jgi:hypothetical protein
MRPLVLILTLIVMADGIETAVARSPRRRQTTSSAPALPPFPWASVLETVSPILAIWLGAVVIRGTLSKEKQPPAPAAGEVASLPVAWFAAVTNILAKKSSESNVEPIQSASQPESGVLTPDL